MTGIENESNQRSLPFGGKRLGSSDLPSFDLPLSFDLAAAAKGVAESAAKTGKVSPRSSSSTAPISVEAMYRTFMQTQPSPDVRSEQRPSQAQPSSASPEAAVRSSSAEPAVQPSVAFASSPDLSIPLVLPSEGAALEPAVAESAAGQLSRASQEELFLQMPKMEAGVLASSAGPHDRSASPEAAELSLAEQLEAERKRKVDEILARVLAESQATSATIDAVNRVSAEVQQQSSTAVAPDRGEVSPVQEAAAADWRAQLPRVESAAAPLSMQTVMAQKRHLDDTPFDQLRDDAFRRKGFLGLFGRKKKAAGAVASPAAAASGSAADASVQAADPVASAASAPDRAPRAVVPEVGSLSVPAVTVPELASENELSASSPASSSSAALSDRIPGGKLSGSSGGAASDRRSKAVKRWRVVFAISLIIFLGASAALGYILFSYWQGQQTYEKVAEAVFEQPLGDQVYELSDVKIDWDALREVNPDVIGWIYMPGTPIDYPVVQTDNDDTYLYRDFEGSEGGVATFGTIFLAAQNSPDLTDKNSVIYGHHLNDGSMFGAIADLEDADMFYGHRTWYLFTPEKNYCMRTMYLVHCSADDPLVQTVFAPGEFVTYMEDKKSRSLHEVDDVPDIKSLNSVFTLITCDNNISSDGRFVLYSFVEDIAPGSESKAGMVGNALVGGGSADASDETTEEQPTEEGEAVSPEAAALAEVDASS